MTPTIGRTHRISSANDLHGKGIRRLTVGKIDDRAVAAFTEGWCWALAYAIEEATGAPVRVLVGPEGFTLHAGVETPDGLLLDIEGAASPDEWVRRWEEREGVDLTIRAITDVERRIFGWMCGAVEDEAMAVARLFVEPVLRQWGAALAAYRTSYAVA